MFPVKKSYRFTHPAGRHPRKEAHRLAAYAKTNELKPGEAQEVTMEVKMDGLTSYDEKRAAWILESGFMAYGSETVLHQQNSAEA